jgi:hypothetical protein
MFVVCIFQLWEVMVFGLEQPQKPENYLAPFSGVEGTIDDFERFIMRICGNLSVELLPSGWLLSYISERVYPNPFSFFNAINLSTTSDSV